MHRDELRVLVDMHQHKERDAPYPIGGLKQLLGDDDAVARVAVSLQEKGLVRRGPRMVPDYHLTADGEAEAQEIRRRREDRGYRRDGCRNEVLSWLDNCTTTTQPADPRGLSAEGDGLEFTQEEVTEALDYLVEHGLARSWSSKQADGSHVVVSITTKGSDCIDSREGVAAFLRTQRASPAVVNHTYNLGGEGSTFATATGSGASVDADVRNFDPDAATVFARAVLEAPDIDIDQETREFAEEVINGSDPGRMQAATRRLYGFVQGSATGGVGAMLGSLGSQALGLG